MENLNNFLGIVNWDKINNVFVFLDLYNSMCLNKKELKSFSKKKMIFLG